MTGSRRWVVDEVVLPAQLAPYPGTTRRPERQLILAVLRDAIRVYRSGGHGRRADRARRETREWLVSDRTDDPFTFVNVCEVMGIDPIAVRASVLAVEPKRAVVSGTRTRRRRIPHGGNGSTRCRAPTVARRLLSPA